MLWKNPVQHFGFKFQCLVDGKDNFLRQNACVSEKIVGQILTKKNIQKWAEITFLMVRENFGKNLLDFRISEVELSTKRMRCLTAPTNKRLVTVAIDQSQAKSRQFDYPNEHWTVATCQECKVLVVAYHARLFNVHHKKNLENWSLAMDQCTEQKENLQTRHFLLFE